MPLLNRRIHKRILEKKKRLNGSRPLPPLLLARLRSELSVEYTYDTNAIEGSTLTLRETRLVIEEGITVSGKSIKEYFGARNHPEAIDFIEGLVEAGREIDEDAILRLHELVMNSIEEEVGRYRASGVRIASATFTPPPSTEVKPRILRLLEWLRGNLDELTPVELAAVFHHRFVQIHPYPDGNGRIARLLMNCILIGYGYPFIVNISNRDRGRYLKCLSEADMGNASPLVNFIARSVERALDIYLQAMEEPELMTLAEASRLSPYSQEYLSLLARRGAIGAFKRGRDWYITREDLDRYVESVRAKRRKE